MGEIRIDNMEFYAYHGHYREEQIVGNLFLVDLVIETDMKKPAATDNLRDAVNYQAAYEIVKREMGKKSNLLENIASRILEAIHEELKGVGKATVRVSKMNPPVGGRVERISVTLSK